jgi:hypothetical protein
MRSHPSPCNHARSHAATGSKRSLGVPSTNFQVSQCQRQRAEDRTAAGPAVPRSVTQLPHPSPRPQHPHLEQQTEPVLPFRQPTLPNPSPRNNANASYVVKHWRHPQHQAQANAAPGSTPESPESQPTYHPPTHPQASPQPAARSPSTVGSHTHHTHRTRTRRRSPGHPSIRYPAGGSRRGWLVGGGGGVGGGDTWLLCFGLGGGGWSGGRGGG